MVSIKGGTRRPEIRPWGGSLPVMVLWVLLGQHLPGSWHQPCLGLSSSIAGGDPLAPTTLGCWLRCDLEESPRGMLDSETCLYPWWSMCLVGSPNLELGSGFSANLMLSLWLHDHTVLVAKKPSCIEHWGKWLYYKNTPCRCRENSPVLK